MRGILPCGVRTFLSARLSGASFPAPWDQRTRSDDQAPKLDVRKPVMRTLARQLTKNRKPERFKTGERKPETGDRKLPKPETRTGNRRGQPFREPDGPDWKRRGTVLVRRSELGLPRIYVQTPSCRFSLSSLLRTFRSPGFRFPTSPVPHSGLKLSGFCSPIFGFGSFRFPVSGFRFRTFPVSAFRFPVSPQLSQYTTRPH